MGGGGGGCLKDWLSGAVLRGEYFEHNAGATNAPGGAFGQ